MVRRTGVGRVSAMTAPLQFAPVERGQVKYAGSNGGQVKYPAILLNCAQTSRTSHGRQIKCLMMIVAYLTTLYFYVVLYDSYLMRLARVTAAGQSFYHCISRVVESRFIFRTSEGGSVEAEYFLTLMRRLEVFCGIRVLNYVLMS